MVTRTRVENFTETKGTAFRKLTGSTITRRRTLTKDTCVDTVIAGPTRRNGTKSYTPSHDAYFASEKLRVTGGIMNGRSSSGNIFTDYPIDAINGYPYFHLNFADKLSDSAYATQVAAETNPSEPLVGVGQTLAELREIPSNIKRRGFDIYKGIFGSTKVRNRIRNSAAAAADLNIRFQFGIKPVVDDLQKLLSIRKALNQRVRDLLKAEKKGGLVKKRTVFEGTRRESDSGIALFSAFGAGSVIYGKRDIVTNTKVWVYCRWVPDGSRALPLHKDKRRQKSLDLFGVNPFNFNNLWNAVPWTWLVDWSWSVGTYIKATNNTVGLRLAALCVCETTSTTITWTITSGLPSGVTCSPCVRKHITKSRRPTKLDISPKNPFASAKQIGILASLVGRKLFG